MNYHPLTQSKWEQTQAKAYERYVSEVLPPKPTKKSVQKRSTVSFGINVLEWIMLLLAIVVYIFVGYKGGINALPYVDALVMKLAGDYQLPAIVLDSFHAVGVLMYAFLPSIAVIYFSILHESWKGQRKEQKLAGWSRWGTSALQLISLDFWTPRLPLAIVYVGIGWLAAISWVGEEFFFLWLIPLLVEVASSHVVAKIIVRFRQFNEAIQAQFVPALEAWESRRDNYEEDKGYFRMLFLELREALREAGAEGMFKGVKPNLELFDDPNRNSEVEAVVLQEYRRWTTGLSFAETVQDEQEYEATVVAVEKLPTNEDGQYVPLHNETKWTTPTLKTHLLRRNIDLSAYNRGNLDREYASGYSARSAYANL